MKLDLDKFPTIKNLADDVREKALEYASTLGARGPRPTTVLGTAVTLAKEWKSGRLPTRPVAAPFLVQPRQGRWIIKRSNEADPSHTFLKKDDAVRRAQELARAAGAACFVFGPGGTLVERYEARTLAASPEPAPVPVPEVVVEAAPEPAPEVVALAPEPAPAPVAKLAPAPEPAPEVIIEVAPEPAPDPITELALALAPEDDDTLPAAQPGDDAIVVKKVGAKWLLALGDGRTETHSTQKKAVARAKAVAKKSGRGVVVA